MLNLFQHLVIRYKSNLKILGYYSARAALRSILRILCNLNVSGAAATLPSQSQDSCDMNEITTSNASHSHRNDKFSSRFTLHTSLKQKTAFTLAEVLITLGIIGVVAAMTIPTVIAKYREKEYVTRLKVVYNVLNQALQMSVIDNGTVNEWGFTQDSEGGKIIADKLLPYIKQVKSCDIKQNGVNKCFAAAYKKLNNVNFTLMRSGGGSFILANGQSVHIYSTYADCINNPEGLCAYVVTDINGNRNPNVLGKDTFYFALSKDKFIPLGQQDRSFADRVYSFENDCYGDGIGCTAWVLFNENMNYLHCEGLSWNGKKNCD